MSSEDISARDNPTCSFCGRSEEGVEKLIAGPSAYICDKCVGLCSSILEKREKPNYQLVVFKPKQIKEHLDEYIHGQEDAKRAISVAVYNHYKRVKSVQDAHEIEFNKSNVLLLGPTGSGKTLIAKTLAKILDVPFSIADATTLTEAGYVGEDVENIILRLVQAADYDVAKAEMGIIYIDEIDKINRTTSNVSITRDVSGEGVQQALLKIVEGTIASIPPKGGRKHPNQEYIKVNTNNILFIIGGAFFGLDKIIAKRLGQGTIGFDPYREKGFSPEDSNALLSKVEIEDLIKFGMIPEFVGRFHTVTHCNPLVIEDLIQILTQPKNAVIKQYQAMFKMDGVTLNFTDEALKAIAEQAIKAGTGARALQMILEALMRDLMYEVPSDESIEEIIIDRDTVVEKKSPHITYAKGSKRKKQIA